ncbi:MAG: ABC transporter permease subunit [Rhizobiaceae bacterium]|nr:ABC transporter permease subunit [Rhizobiaceae bacterium]
MTVLAGDEAARPPPSRLPLLPRGAGLAAGLVVLVFAVLFVWPIVRLIATTVFVDARGWTAFATIVSSPMYRTAFTNTFFISGLVTLITLLAAYPIAYFMATVQPRTAKLIAFVVLLPFWTSALVRTTAWMVLLQRRGIVNSLLMNTGITDAPIPLLYNLSGVIIGMVHVLLPFMVLPLYATFLSVDQRLIAAAEGLGAPRFTVLRRIVLPLTAPGAAAGALIVFMSAIGTFITPVLMGGPRQMMIAQAISYHMQKQLDWQMAGALSLVLLAVTLVLFLVYRQVFGLDRLVAADAGVAGDPDGPLRGVLGLGRLPAGIMAVAVGLFLIAPIAMVYPLSISSSPFLQFPPARWTFDWYAKLADDPKWLRAALSSLRVAAEAIALSVILGTAAAVAASRIAPRLRAGMEVLILLPMVVPTIITAIALYSQYAPLGILGSPESLAIGHTILAAPFVFITVSASLKSFDRNLELAALGLGASWSAMFRRIMLPAILPGILAGAVFAFITSFDDVVLSIFLTNSASRTLPRVIYEGIKDDTDPAVVALAAILITISFGAFLLSLLARDRRA